MKAIQIYPTDNVAVALCPLQAGEEIVLESGTVILKQDIAQGHKFAVQEIAEGQPIQKYGYPIGIAKEDIHTGEWVHVHNVRTGLSEEGEYRYQPSIQQLNPQPTKTFKGFLRKDGRAAIRNELWIIPTVGCVNGVAQRLVQQNQHLVAGNIDGLYSFGHPFGCSQMGDDHAQTRKLLAALVNHPNAGGVLVLSLGCENLTQGQFKAELGEWDEQRVKFLVCQEVEDEFEAGSKLLAELADYAKGFERQELPASKLVIVMKCGGSDGLSGITANPTVGRFSDLLIAQGGTTILTEVPEMFGAEAILMNRCVNEQVFDKAVRMVNDFKHYFVSHGQVVYENPSPGNDLVSATALTAAGAHLVLFTTGRGTPFGAPAPTVKIATNNALAGKKSGWIDFNAGSVAEGEPLQAAGERLLDYVLQVASRTQTQSEQHGYREISIFKDGVVL